MVLRYQVTIVTALMHGLVKRNDERNNETSFSKHREEGIAKQSRFILGRVGLGWNTVLGKQ